MVIQQTWALTRKNLLLIVVRSPISFFIRALVFPIILTLIVSYSKYWSVGPGDYGVGSPLAIRSLPDALAAGKSVRSDFVIIDHGLKTPAVNNIINNLTATVEAAGLNLHRIHDPNDVFAYCPATLGGITPCFAAVEFQGSPQDNATASWQYTLWFDYRIDSGVSVNSDSTPAEIYTLPLQQHIDSLIIANSAQGQRSGRNPAVNSIKTIAFTQQTNEQHQAREAEKFQTLLASVLGFVYFLALCGITYHMVGFMSSERESGMSNLIEAMSQSRWQVQIARLVSYHVSFSLAYLPGWIGSGAITGRFLFPDTPVGATIGLYILTGLALASMSLLGGAFFRKAQLSGIVIVICALLFALVAQFAFSFGTGGSQDPGVYAVSFLFPPSAFILFLQEASAFQLLNQPFDLSFTVPIAFADAIGFDLPWSVPGQIFLIFLTLQIFWLPVLAMLVERYRHLVPTRGREILEQTDSTGAAVQIEGFSKIYPASGWFKRFCCCCCGSRTQKKPVKAAQDINLTLYRGTTTVLLGANGSGKTSTLNAIAGIHSISEGTIRVEMDRGLGLCPQKNVAWDKLTVREHVEIFTQLKVSRSDIDSRRSSIEDLLSRCDLGRKLDAQSRTLSGGQKRKLQLAMMLSGGSQVCCIDECSSGIDPLARRKIWEVLLAERGKRTILLTTHFLDEADALADHIAIMSKGQLKVQGSAAQLKASQADGYKVVIARDLARAVEVQHPHVHAIKDNSDCVFCCSTSEGVAYVTAQLDGAGIPDYKIQGPTIEDVFLKLSEEVDDASSEVALSQLGKDMQLELSPGKGLGFGAQMRVMLHKRLLVLRRNYVPHLVAFGLPILVAGLVTMLLTRSLGHGDIPFVVQYPHGVQCGADVSAGPHYLQRYDLVFTLSEDLFGPAGSVNNQSVARILTADENRRYFRTYGGVRGRYLQVDSKEAFMQQLQNNASAYYEGGFYNDPENPWIAYSAEYDGTRYAAASLNIAHRFLADMPIVTQYASFESGGNSGSASAKPVQTAIYLALAMCIAPGLFALYPAMERLTKVRALHYSNGIRSGPLWVAYALFDFSFVLVYSIVAVILWAAIYSGFYELGYLFVVFFLFGVTSMALAYWISLWVSSQVAAFALSGGMQLVLLLLNFMGYYLSGIYAPPGQLASWLDYQFFTIALISPAASLLRALFISVNQWSLACRGNEFAPYPGAIQVYGGPILYLVVQALLLIGLLALWESGGRFGLRQKRLPAETGEEKQATGLEDAWRLAPDNDGLRVMNMSKQFGRNVAVDDVSFGIQRGETFALLGPNGAGKSTAISLIRGDLEPSTRRGNVFVSKHSLFEEPMHARAELGICPQFDAVEPNLTVREHLLFYARARGVASPAANTDCIMRYLRLDEYADRRAVQLSGGNKRKLSLAIALVGDPTVLLLDEPSSSMDVAAKRTMWGILKSLAQLDKALLITTHSMEEADALCHRAGIMASRMLALGTTDSLRQRYAGRLYIQLIHTSAPTTTPETMADLLEWITLRLPGAAIEPGTSHGQVRLSVDTAQIQQLAARAVVRPGRVTPQAMSYLFGLLEENKAALGLAYYTISPAAMDQVFLRVVGEHEVEEQDSEAVAKRWWWSR